MRLLAGNNFSSEDLIEFEVPQMPKIMRSSNILGCLKYGILLT
jgi:hypothetical protein